MMQDTARTVTERNGQPSLNMHLCNNYRHLLIALASILADGEPALVVYLEDDLPLPPTLRARLAMVCPQAEFLFTTDRAQMQDFARLPGFFPALLRRNLSVSPSGLVRPIGWQPHCLAGRRFRTGYLYHSGFFFAKVSAGLCDRVVLRESGLNNYVPHAVPALKSIVRLASGLPARKQIWGEESWVDVIEVARPDDLPAAVRAKARKLTFDDVMNTLSAKAADDLGAAFLGDVPLIDSALHRSAILLTQPLDSIGLCSPDQKVALYQSIAARLHAAGYEVTVKHHPRDAGFDVVGTTQIPAAFPIEAWPYFTPQRFALAVAICSAALAGGSREFAQTAIQLLPPNRFNLQGFPQWESSIAAALRKLSGPEG